MYLCISHTSTFALRGRCFASDCRIGKFKSRGQLAPNIVPWSPVHNSVASAKTFPASSFTIVVPFSCALGSRLSRSDGSICGLKSTYNGSEVISSPPDNCRNAWSTYSVWTTLRWGGRLGGKLTYGHRMANRKLCPTPPVGGKLLLREAEPFASVEGRSVFLAGALPFDGEASQRISWMENN